MERKETFEGGEGGLDQVDSPSNPDVRHVMLQLAELYYR